MGSRPQALGPGVNLGPQAQAAFNAHPGEDEVAIRVLPGDTLPHLGHVSAPLSTLRTIQETSSVRIIDVCEPTSSDEALVQVQTMSTHLQNVVTITLRLTEMGNGALVGTILGGFRQLKNCDVRVVKEGAFADAAAIEVRLLFAFVGWTRPVLLTYAFFQIIETLRDEDLPPQLRIVTISGIHIMHGVQKVGPQFPGLTIEVLRQKCPALKRVFVMSKSWRLCLGEGPFHPKAG